MADLEPGSLVQRYSIEGTLGKGGMGVVYAAVDTVRGERVALKTMHRELAEDPVLEKRFLREARATMAVPHPSIVRIHEVFEHGGAPWIAMELLDGETLEQLLRRERKLPLPSVSRILVHVASAVGTAHALGIVHRDLKPENIFLQRGAEAVKVVDFGIAKLTATDGLAAATQALTSTGAMLGTPFYMSPEQAAGEKRIDHRADIWSLGIILYRCLSGVLPTEGKSFGEIFKKVVGEEFTPLRELVPDLPSDVAQLVESMLRKPRDERLWDLRDAHTVLGRHADESAPAFAEAVLSTWDEPSQEGQLAAPQSPTGTVAMSATPPGLRLAPSAVVATSHTPMGTMIVDPPSHALAPPPHAVAPTIVEAGVEAPRPAEPAPLVPTLSEPAPPSRSSMPLVIAVVLAVGAAIALAVRLLG
jgi:eukaryotic-like serine/threonine-protein kinase